MFGDFPSKDFPLLCKIVDAGQAAIVHVHPDDSYAYEFENMANQNVGILLMKEDAEVLIGTTVNSKKNWKIRLTKIIYWNL